LQGYPIPQDAVTVAVDRRFIGESETDPSAFDKLDV